MTTGSHSAKLPFFHIREEPITMHLQENPLNVRPLGEPARGPIKGIETDFLIVIYNFKNLLYRQGDISRT